MPTIDTGWLDQHQRFPPPGPQPPQKQPKQTVSWAKAPVGTSEDAKLVVQGKNLEQQVSTRRLNRSDRSPVLMTARIAGSVPTDANVNDFRLTQYWRGTGRKECSGCQGGTRSITADTEAWLP
jgi:hypothetical protein